MPNNDTPPPEDDITKTVLWDRINTLHDTVELINGQLQNRINTFLDAAKNMTQGQLEENKEFVQGYGSQLDSKLNAFAKQIQETIYTATEDLKKSNQKTMGLVEEKIRLMQTIIPGIVTAQTRSYLDPTNDKVLKIAKDVDVFKKSLLETVGKFNTEAVNKISALNTKLDETLKKFRNLSSAI